MFSGGIADKLGNRYEAKWLVLQLLDVIGGKSSALTFEGIDPSFKGFEFSLVRNGITEWHQTKISSPNGNWTLAALKREGILEAFKHRFSSTSDDLCVFVSQHPARDIADLVGKAEIAKDEDEFVKSLGKGASANLDELKLSWGVDDETAFGWLNRCHFRVESQRTIESIIDTYCDFYFDNKLQTGFEILQEFLIQRINREITTESARAEIQKEGKLKLKDYALDTTLAQRLQAETAAYLDTYIPFGAGREALVRPEAQQLADRIADPNGPPVILLTGVAGAGKSGVIRELIAKLSLASTTHLAFRVDHYLDCKSPQAFGKAITGREESPVATLRGVSIGQKSVLIVDQVDAISEISGRNGAIKQAVLKLVDDVRNFGSVVIVISCRTFDLENDDRLKALKEAHGVEHIDVQLLDWENSVKPLLLSKSVAVAQFSPNQIELLRLPLNLALFFETYDPSAPTFSSRNELFRLLLEKKRKALGTDRTISWDVLEPLSRLAEWMSERQRLDAPDTMLSSFGGALHVLPSEGLLVRSRGNVNFFHESFFDYVYALTFAGRNISLEALLLQTEQHLFRRTQVRQILENLRQVDDARYLRELRSVVGNPKIRYHIQVAAAQWLGSLIDPTPEERDIVVLVDTKSGPIPALVRYAFFASPGWFDRLQADGWVPKQLLGANTERADTVLWWMSNIASERPVEVAGLLDKWWAGDPERAKRLLNWFGFVKRQKPDDTLVDLCARVTRSNPPEMFEGRGQNNRDLLLHTWAGENPHGAEKVLKAYFEAWFEAHPGLHPFERDEFRDLDAHSLGELAKKAPEVFIDGTIETFIRSVDSIVLKNSNGINDYSFMMRFASGNHFGADAFLSMFRDALAKVALGSPDKAREILKRIDPGKHEVCAHIWLETIAVNGSALKDLFVELLGCRHIFDAGWNGADWKSFASAARAALPHLQADGIAKFDNLIAGHKPELDFASKLLQRIKADGEEEPWRTRSGATYHLNRSGHEVWCILDSIGDEALSPLTRKTLAQLRRKFRTDKLPEPDHLEAHWVQSPLKRDKAARMTDEHWLSAILKYDNDDHRRRGRTFVEGGARQLAGELQHQAKEQPQRFSAFLEKIPPGANHAYISHLLWGLAESEGASLEALKRAIVTVHEREERAYGSEIARLIEKNPEVAADPLIFEILVWYVENGDANETDAVDRSNTEREVTTVEDLISQGHLHVRGVNGARGAAAEALGNILWRVPEVVEPAWSIAERRAAVEPLVSVRCCLVRAALPLYNSDKARCARLLERISGHPEIFNQPAHFQAAWVKAAFLSRRFPTFAKAASVRIAYAIERVIRRRSAFAGSPDESDWLAPLVTHHGVRLLPYILRFVPEAGHRLLYRMIVHGDPNTRAIAAWLVFWQSFQAEVFCSLADALAKDGVVYRRLMADVASHAIEDAEFRYRAETILRRSFNDDDKQVRSQAGDVFRNVKPDQFDRYRELAHDFIRSPAFEGGSYGFFHALEQAECKVDDIVVAATKILMDDIGKNGNAAGRRSMDLHQLQDIIKKEYAVSEGDPPLRAKILDLIDSMLKMELYGVDAIVGAHER
ncbi:ATP-binding protein (plasmid) [Sinorhizobium numidicum]|uniref:ATP-binding protein n=1 Tax=Sinorhizobium numidicum TaxID=680248 RepID=A0ABY8D427_9HYPH|nr:AAA family ATPase [Sinorhizobium numidicum]WEX79418.1 ATP-binding protein [Sinorhizobium numidicum]WEX85626.1 ATP-binding protein [Sinorhizobium numidicum]